MYSDEVIGLDIAHRREQRQLANAAQAMVNSLDSDINSLRRQLRQAQAAVARERGLRIVAEAKLEEILNMEI